jgi:hypothetical protein
MASEERRCFVQIRITGSPAQTLVVWTMTNLTHWEPIGTNTLSSIRWVVTNAPSAAVTNRFFKAMLAPPWKAAGRRSSFPSVLQLIAL